MPMKDSNAVRDSRSTQKTRTTVFPKEVRDIEGIIFAADKEEADDE